VTIQLDCCDRGMNHGHSDSRKANRRIKLYSLLSCVLMILVSAIYCSVAVAQPVQELHTVRQLKALSAEQAGLNMPGRLRGTVTVLSGWKSAFFLEDATGGISIERAENSPSLRAGDSQAGKGHAPGSARLCVACQSVERSGHT
jgi:hypothetical protein